MIVGLGTDVVEIARVRRLLDAKGARALARLFTPDEVAYARGRSDPVPHLAARLAAKEAAFKALAGTPAARGIGWRDLEVAREWDGRPTLRLHRHAAERADELGVTRIWLSLTHSATSAIAFVILERDRE